MKRSLIIFFSLILLLVIGQSVTYAQPSGSGVVPTRPLTKTRHQAPLQSFGTPRILVILAEFPDNRFHLENPRGYFGEALNGRGFSDYGASGSVLEWFEANSDGRFRPEFEIVGPVTLPEGYRYYGRNDVFGTDNNPGKMVADACTLALPQTDLTRFDTDGDNVADLVYIFYAGDDDSVNSDYMRPRNGSLIEEGFRIQANGCKVDNYAFSNEWSGESPAGIGTFLYICLRQLGLPDLSESDSSVWHSTPGAWDIMDTGYQNDFSRTPPYLSALEKQQLGWLEPRLLTSPTEITLLPQNESNEAVKILAGENGNEYFLLEYRWNEGWDSFLPGHGLLVWHIDYNPKLWASGRVNNDAARPGVSLVKANNIEMVKKSSTDFQTILGGWAFPGWEGVTDLSDTTLPSMKNREGEATAFPLSGITEDTEAHSVSFTAGDAMLARIPKGIAPAGEDMGDDWFVASWYPIEGVSTYLLTLYIGPETHSGVQQCHFGDQNILKMPKGWETTSTSVYTSPIYCGESSPSLRLKDDGATLTTPYTPSGINSITFWARSINADLSTLLLSGLDSEGHWHLLDEITIPDEGTVLSYDSGTIPEGIYQMRFLFHRYAGSIAIDDVNMEYGSDPIICENYDGVKVEGATRLRIDQLPEDTDIYRFTVRAVHEGHISDESVPVTVILARSEVDNLEKPSKVRIKGKRILSEKDVIVYSSSGIEIGRGKEITVSTDGLYLIVPVSGQTAYSEKIIVKVK